MPPPKKAIVQCLQNIKSRQQPAEEELVPNLESDGPVASSSRLTLDMMPTAYTHIQPEWCDISESPDKLAGTLENLTIEVLLEDNIVLEDPPDEEDDPEDERNPSSLAESEGDEASALPPFVAKEPPDNEESTESVEHSF